MWSPHPQVSPVTAVTRKKVGVSPHPHASQREGATVGSSSIGARLESCLPCSFSILVLNRLSNSCGKKLRRGFLADVLRFRFRFFFLGAITNYRILGWWRRQVNAACTRDAVQRIHPVADRPRPARFSRVIETLKVWKRRTFPRSGELGVEVGHVLFVAVVGPGGDAAAGGHVPLGRL